ncbi:MAG: organic hydroperoxide resistance protein [Actinobacteria bacterium 13_2_20CM_2_71_6]|nr:MAG: organic hydroperoxide resistance protein [Actinobacteria bacterium 13_2_20CM_2_71_6]
MSQPTVYQTAATSTGDGRNGRSRTVDGILDVALATPKELGGAGGATNPEQLFAAGYAACFHSALKLVARRMRIELTDSAVTVDVGLVKRGPGFGLQVAIEAELPGVEPEQARALLDTAHQVCPYSAAIQGNVEVSVTLA